MTNYEINTCKTPKHSYRQSRHILDTLTKYQDKWNKAWNKEEQYAKVIGSLGI